MNPRAVEVHIEELILHGFDPGARWNVADALEDELRGLLVKQGILNQRGQAQFCGKREKGKREKKEKGKEKGVRVELC